MQIGKPPIVDGAPGASSAAGAQSSTVRQGAMAPPAADRADIRPLSVAAALQILMAEVFDAWALAAPQPPPDTALRAALVLVQTFLQAVPDTDADPHALLASHDGLLASLERGILRAQDIVATWHDVPPEAVDAVRETRALVFAALAEEPSDPALGPWVMRPELLEFAPRIIELRRRRRRARRRLLDPDLPLPEPDDSGDRS
jgi:hypothetical protein